MERKDNVQKHDKHLEKIYHKIGLKYHIRDAQVEQIIDSMYNFIFEEINNNNISDLDSLDGVKTNFLIKYFGKFHSNDKLLIKHNNNKTKAKKNKNEKKES